MTRSAEPLVSVVVPCLNRAVYLRPTVDSILSQDYPNVECIVIDGGSTDGTLDILRSYGERIRWISEPDDGHADAINKGWKMSRGEIVAWLNADDLYVVNDAVRRAVEAMVKEPDVAVLYGDYVHVDVDGKPVGGVLRPAPWELARAVLECDYVIAQPSSFMRRSALERIGWLDPSYRNGKDHEVWLRLSRVGRLQYAPILFAAARVCPGLTDQPELADAKVRLTREFLAGAGDLGPPFNSSRFRRRALSNAHVVGAQFLWYRASHRARALAFLGRALAADPTNAPRIVAWALRMLFRLVPGNRPVRQLVQGLRGRTASP